MKKSLIALVLVMVLPHSLLAEPLWSDVPLADNAAASSAFPAQAAPSDPHKNSRRVSVSFDQLTSTLASANTSPAGQAQKSLSPAQIELPMPYGGLKTFNVVESSVMEAELAAKYPQIKTYKVSAVDDPSVTGALDTGPNGFHGYLFTAEGEVFIDPIPATAPQEYYSYYKRDYASTAPKQFSCGVTTTLATESPVAEFKTLAYKTLARTSDTKITYRIAIAATGEYTQAVGGGNVTATLGEITTAINRISFIYERDLAIQLKLIVNNDQIIFTDPLNDPYDPTNASQLLDENQATLDDVSILGPSANDAGGATAYDIGHVFSVEGGGLAALGAACVDGDKARGQSGHPNPIGDPFYIDMVAHEIGHQLGANHSFNGTTKNCAYPNRNQYTAYEPGSGTSIMAYAGICGAENVTANGVPVYSDATFHAGSIIEIINYTRLSVGNTCAGTLTGQQAPTNVNAGQDWTIPGGTAFTLTGSATDPENDVMTYQWDEMDVGAATTSLTYGSDIGSNALFRSFLPAATPERTFPQVSTLISNVADKAETLPTENRTLNFRFTARDGNGGVNEDDMQVTVNGKAGPFEILQPNTNVILSSGLPQSIQWNAACTSAAPVNCANVDILLSTDGGQNFDTVLLASTPNSGAASVILPAGNTAMARIKVACSDNIFFDISNVDFQINDAIGGSLPSALIGGSYNCGTAKIKRSGSSSGTLTPYWLFMLLITPLLRLTRKV